MPQLMRDRGRAFCLSAALLSAACGNLESHAFSVQTAASGTQVEAREIVSFVYAQRSDAALEKILYSYGDIWLAARRMRDRYPRLKPWLDDGAVGNTTSGFVALRDEGRREQLRDLLWEENHDRAVLHAGATVAVGHGNNDLNSWLPYASSSFGAEWIAQSQPGWWWLDDERQWHRK
ncbi:MAG TPA: DUF1318 domain-containing protein [Rhodocyclaceae bacterium]